MGGKIIKRATFVFVAVYLVISVHFLVSLSLAAITDHSVTGRDGLKGIIATRDQIKVIVETDVLKDPRYMFFDMDGQVRFQSCSLENGTWNICTYTSTLKERTGGPKEYKITDTQGNSMVQGKLYADNLGPVFSRASIDITEGRVDLSFDATDSACSGCGTACAGIASVNLESGRTIIKSYPGSLSCSLSGEDSIPLSSLNLPQGNTELCLSAIDNFGQKGPRSCKKIFFDSTKPLITSISLLDKDGNPFSYVSNGRRLLKVIINVSEDNLKYASGDFSTINSIISSNYRNIGGGLH